MKHLVRLFKYRGKCIVTNMDFSAIPDNLDVQIPLAVRSAKTFETRQALDTFCHNSGIHTIAIKCAYEPSVHVGIDNRMVGRNAIYGHFGDKEKTPFIVENLKIHGKGKSAYYLGIKQTCELKDHNSAQWQYPETKKDKTVELSYNRKGTNFQAYHWEPCKIPINSVIGTIIYWSEFLDNPEVIPYKDLDILKNHTIKFRDKRPNYRENRIPDGTHTGTKCANYVGDTAPKKYYSVKFVDSVTGEIHWKRQNNCQLRDVDIPAQIEAGNIIAL